MADSDKPTNGPSQDDTDDDDDILDSSIWSLGIHDAHCHPTDTMGVIPEIRERRIRTMTIMATRSNDQELVAQVAREFGIDRLSPDEAEGGGGGGGDTTCRVVPSFGWHPWFSHTIYDDLGEFSSNDSSSIFRSKHLDSNGTVIISKIEHYESVLTPVPPESFVSKLPDPKPLSELISQTRKYLEEFPSALVGEIGIDRTFRLPNSPKGWRAEDMEVPNEDDPDSDRRRLSPYKVQTDHQKRVLEAQLRLAGEMGRAVSVHGVGAHGLLYDCFQAVFRGHERKIRSKRTKKRGPHDFEGDESSEDSDADDTVLEVTNESGEIQPQPKRRKTKPYPPRICLHSFSAPPEFIRTWLSPKIPASIFFSFSTAINTRYGDRFSEMLKLVPEDKLLTESDLHVASVEMERHLCQIVNKISRVRGWSPRDTVVKVGKNWGAFVFGMGGRGRRMTVD